MMAPSPRCAGHILAAARDVLALRAAPSELVPEKRYLFVPALAKAVGSTFLERRVASLQPDVHVFGVTRPAPPRVSHDLGLAGSRTLDGTRYVQACLAYPRERRDRLTTVAAVCCPADAPPTRDVPALHPVSGRAGAVAPQRGRRVRAALPVRLVCVLRRESAAAGPDARAAPPYVASSGVRAGRRRGRLKAGVVSPRARC